MVLTDDEAIAKKINSAVFPGLQGGPLMHVIAAKAVAFGEALQPEFKTYARAVIANAKALAGRLKERGADLVAGGTDTHLALVDLRPLGITGKDADEALERAAITCNKNGVPFDPLPPVKTSGIRVGSPAGTTRGFGVSRIPRHRRHGRRRARRARQWRGGNARSRRDVESARRASCAPASRSIRTLISDDRSQPRRAQHDRPRHRRSEGDGQGRLGPSLDQTRSSPARRSARLLVCCCRIVDPGRPDRRRGHRPMAAHQALRCAARFARMKTAR